jgi:hypothetical protein
MTNFDHYFATFQTFLNSISTFSIFDHFLWSNNCLTSFWQLYRPLFDHIGSLFNLIPTFFRLLMTILNYFLTSFWTFLTYFWPFSSTCYPFSDPFLTNFNQLLTFFHYLLLLTNYFLLLFPIIFEHSWPILDHFTIFYQYSVTFRPLITIFDHFVTSTWTF